MSRLEALTSSPRIVDTEADFSRNREPRAGLRPMVEAPLSTVDIPIVGFNVKKEINSLSDQINVVGQNRSIAGHKENIESWIKEYVLCEAVIPIHYSINEQGWIVDKSGRRVLEQIDPDEREGAVSQVWEKNENFFANAQVGSVSMLWSPEGCSNLKDDRGDEIEFPDSYFYFFSKEVDGLKGFALRTNLSVLECQKLFCKLRDKYKPFEPIPFLGTDKKTVTNSLVKNSLDLSSQKDRFYSINELVDEIVALKSSPFEGENSSVEQVYAALNQEQEIEQNLLLDQYINDLSSFLGRFPDAIQTIFGQKWVERQMSETLVKILLDSKGESFGSENGQLTWEDHKKAVKYMQHFRGCFGTGKGNGIASVMTIGGLRLGLVDDSNEWENGKCYRCGQITVVLCNFCKSCGEEQAA